MIDRVNTPTSAFSDLATRWQEVRRRVNQYDQAADMHQSFWGDAGQNALIRGTRDYVGQAMDNHFAFDNPFFKALGNRFEPMANNAIPYPQLFGLHGYYTPTKESSFRTLINDIRDNFKEAHLPTISLKDYLKKTVINDNVRIITQPLAEGRLCFGLSKVFGGCLAAIPVIQRTIKTKSWKVFCKESEKALASWEVGILTMALFQALFPLGAFRIVAGLIGMALASTATKRFLN